MRARLVWVCAVFAVLLVAGRETADATIVIKKNLAQLASESERIVVARVGSQSCAWAPKTRLIFTYTEMQVEQTLKGKHEPTLTVGELGGQIGNLACQVAGMPRYVEGERVVIFLKKDPLGQWRTHGLVQGRFSVVENLATGEQLVKLDPAMPHVHQKYFATKADRTPRIVSLEEFQLKTDALVKAAKAEKKEVK